MGQPRFVAVPAGSLFAQKQAPSKECSIGDASRTDGAGAAPPPPLPPPVT